MKNLKSLLKFKRTSEGYYEKEMNNNLYSIRQNYETKDWHLYVDDEWSNEVTSCKTGKLLAIAKALDIEY